MNEGVCLSLARYNNLLDIERRFIRRNERLIATVTKAREKERSDLLRSLEAWLEYKPSAGESNGDRWNRIILLLAVAAASRKPRPSWYRRLFR